MKRRTFLALAGSAAALPHVAFAQQAAKVPRIVVLSVPVPAQYFDALMQGLADHGYVDGSTISVERYTAPTNADLPLLAAKAVSTAPDVIVALGSNPSLAARNATDKIPIVFGSVSDPVGIGLMSALAHPDRNLTGTSNLAPDLAGKQLSILREVIPRLSRLVVMALPADPGTSISVSQMLVLARGMNVDAQTVDFSEGQDLNAQFQRVVATPREVVFVPSNTYFNNNRDSLFDLCLENKVATMSTNFVEGAKTPFIGNICYGASSPAAIRRSASFVHDILMGAKPNDLPVEQPTVFDFAVNLDMSRKIGLTIPNSILAQATLVIDYDIRAPK